MAGYPFDKPTINARLGYLATTLRDILDQAQRMKSVFDATPDADLTAMGFTTTEIAQMKSAVADMAALANIGEGLATQASTKDFFAFAKFLQGVV